jgi:hypothetical protein
MSALISALIELVIGTGSTLQHSESDGYPARYVRGHPQFEEDMKEGRIYLRLPNQDVRYVASKTSRAFTVPRALLKEVNFVGDRLFIVATESPDSVTIEFDIDRMSEAYRRHFLEQLGPPNATG